MIQRCIYCAVSFTAVKCVMLNQIYKEMESLGLFHLCLAIDKGGAEPPAINTVLFKHLTIRTSRF